MKKIVVHISLLVILASLLISCAKQLKPDGHPTQEDFANKVKTFPFEAAEGRRLQVTKNYFALELGMTKQQVTELIGEPDYWVAGRPLERVTISSWVYAFHCESRSCGMSSNDKLIQIVFDLDDKIVKIAPSENLNLEPKLKAKA